MKSIPFFAFNWISSFSFSNGWWNLLGAFKVLGFCNYNENFIAFKSSLFFFIPHTLKRNFCLDGLIFETYKYRMYILPITTSGLLSNINYN
jgi:hypothetical protein